MATTTNFGWTTPNDTDLVKDGAAAIRTLGQSIDTSLVDLKGGTTGQVLAKNSNTDMDFVWSNDAAGMTNPMTTTGDVIYSSSGSTPARLGIGTAGQVLQVNSGATAPEWATPAGFANFTLLNAGGTALTGAATVTVSGISGKDKIMVLVSAASSTSAGAEIKLRLNTDSGSNYRNYGANLEFGSTYSAGMGQATGNFTESGIVLGKLSTNAASVLTGYVSLNGCNTAGIKMSQSVGGSTAGGGTDHIHSYSGGFYSGSSTISSVSLFTDGGTFDAGTIFVYASA